MLLQSPFLEKLGFAILHNLWQVGLLWLLLQAIEKIFPLSSSGKYYSGLAMQLLSLICFIVTFYNYPASKDVTNTQSAIFITNQLKPISSTLPYLAFIYLSLLSVFFIKWLVNYIYTIRLQTQGITNADASLQYFIDRHIQLLGLTKKIKVYISDRIKSPVTIGSFKPFILLPIATVNGLSVEQLEAILLHELAHIKRYDFLWNILLTLIETILFFNPFVKIINKHIDKHREYICDDWVLQTGYKPMPYAEALLSLARTQAGYTFALAATGNKNQLLTRIQRMLGVSTQEKQRYSLLPIIGIFSIMLITTICSSMQKPNVIQHKVEQLSIQSLHTFYMPDNSDIAPLCKPEIKVLTLKQNKIKALKECTELHIQVPPCSAVPIPPIPPIPTIEITAPPIAPYSPKANEIHSYSFNEPVTLTLSLPNITFDKKNDDKKVKATVENKQVEDFSFKFEFNDLSIDVTKAADCEKFADNIFKAASNVQLFFSDKELKAYTAAIQGKVNKAAAQLAEELKKSQFVNNIQNNEQLMALLKDNKPAQEAFFRLINLKKMQQQIEKKEPAHTNATIILNNDAVITQ